MDRFSVFLKTIVTCTSFMVVGPTLILLNKFIMKELHFPYPIFLSAIGVFCSGICANALVELGFATLDNSTAAQGSNYYRRILPIAVSSAGTLACGNYVYLLLDVGLIQMLKCFTPVIVMAGLYISNIETPNRNVTISILLISFGTAITCSFVPNASILGFFVMFLSSAFEAIRMVLTQYIIKDLKFGVVESQYFLSSSIASCLFLASCFSEIPEMLGNGALHRLTEHFGYFLLAGALGTVVNYLTSFVIQLTSSLNVKILGTMRNIILIIVSVVFYGEFVSAHEMFGYLMALTGFVGYNASQMKLWTSKLSTSTKESLSPAVSPRGEREPREVSPDDDFDSIEE